MTTAAERLREAHRGFVRAALRTFGLRFVEVDDFNVIVEGDYQLNLAMSFWRAIDGSCQGYLVSALAAAIGRQRPSPPLSPNPAEGRDSSAASRTTVRQMTGSALAESSAGSPTAELLPETWP
jgi:hypothetical protein